MMGQPAFSHSKEMINMRTRRLYFFEYRLLLLLALLLAISPILAAERHALLIGISQYQKGGAPNLADLPGTQNDLILLQDVLQNRLEIKSDHIHILRDAEATHQNIERAFQAFAQRVQPGDFVYIHYSGHGSYIPDETGRKREGAYQTWVGYGARAPDVSGLDHFDILDDELNQWLALIDERAGELVYVSDSCHAATNTRGDAMASRAAPPNQQRDHPRIGQLEAPHRFRQATLIYASRDDESAQEFMGEDQKPYGLFTWYWAQSLRNVKLGETWEQVFTRAANGVRAIHEEQHPQLEGAHSQRTILGGQLSDRPAVMVRRLVGSDVDLDAGRLSGVTLGSRYRTQQGESPAELEVTQVSATQSQARLLQGSVQVGDFLIESEHVYETAPLKLFLLTSPTLKSSSLKVRLNETLEQLGGYEIVSDQQSADLVVTLIQPKILDGQPVFTTGPRDATPCQMNLMTRLPKCGF
jgi:hypothetical protein